jgi:hypothetical protein
MREQNGLEFKRHTTRSSDDLMPQDLDNLIRGKQGTLCCISCNTEITSYSMRKQVNGDTEHSFANPALITFHITCFAEAENLLHQGQKTPQDTWFPGHLWQIVLCKHCGLQLGWEFSGPSDFYALISNRLRDCDAD